MRVKGRDRGGIMREEYTVWSYGRVNKPLKVSGHEFKIRAVSMVAYISLAALSCINAAFVSLMSHKNQMSRQD